MDNALAIIKDSSEPTLTAQEAAAVLRCNPQSLREAARDEKTRAKLGFPVVVIGTRVLIPRQKFLEFLGET